MVIMKRFTLFLLILSIALSCTSIFAAEDLIVIKENVAWMEGATYSWSGTWQNNGVNSEAGDPGHKCFDQNTSTKWGSADVANGDQWVAVTFPEAVTIHGFKLWQDNGPWTNITGFKLQIQNGSETWEDIYTSQEFTEKWETTEDTFETAHTATAFRVYLPAENAGGKSAVELTEVHVYAYHTITYGYGSGDTKKEYDEATVAEVSLANAIALASSIEQPASNAIDGNIDTKWSSVGNTVPQWIQIVLPEVTNISGFKVYPDFGWTDVVSYKVEASTQDGWKTVYEHSGSSIREGDEVALDTLWNTDSLRITVTEVGQEAIAGHGTTSVDFREVVLLTAAAVEEEPETNPQTDDMSLIAVIAFTALLGCCLIKRRESVTRG